MSTSHPPRGCRLMFTLIADHYFGNGADLWWTQSSSASVRKSTRRRMLTTPRSWRLLDHRVYAADRGAQ
jgi:hypothetical protein